MPPRKSNISQISATDPDGAGTPLKERDGINIEDLSLPKTMVQRLAKGVLPPNTSLGKDAIIAMQKGATVFVNYLAQAANTSTTNANKRTIPPPAVLEALVDLEFDSFVPRVEAELNKYNEVQVGKRNEYRRKVKEEKMGGGKAEEEEEGRAAKRVRREEGVGLEVNGNGMGNGEVGDGHEQLQVGGGYAEVEEGDEELDVQGDGEGEEDTANTSREVRSRRSGEGEEEEVEEEEEEEDEEEEDDEDEYPDEGRRLSSVEREAHEGRGGGYVDDDPMDKEQEEDEEGLSDVSD